MMRAYAIVAIVVGTVLGAECAFCQAPSTAKSRVAEPAVAPQTPAAAKGEYSPATPTASTPGTPGDEADRLRLWNSADMVKAREWLVDRSRRSARFGPAQAQRYIARLEQASPQAMNQWLKSFKARQTAIARSEAVAREARQMAVEQALDRLATEQQAYANVNINKNQAAQIARDKYAAQQQFGHQMNAINDLFRSVQSEPFLKPEYDWIFPSENYRRVAAAASLPGDLPRGDPLNFYRGDDRGGEPGPNIEGANPSGGIGVVQGAAAAAAAAGGGGGVGDGGGGGGGGDGSP